MADANSVSEIVNPIPSGVLEVIGKMTPEERMEDEEMGMSHGQLRDIENAVAFAYGEPVPGREEFQAHARKRCGKVFTIMLADEIRRLRGWPRKSAQEDSVEPTRPTTPEGGGPAKKVRGRPKGSKNKVQSTKAGDGEATPQKEG